MRRDGWKARESLRPRRPERKKEKILGAESTAEPWQLAGAKFLASHSRSGSALARSPALRSDNTPNHLLDVPRKRSRPGCGENARRPHSSHHFPEPVSVFLHSAPSSRPPHPPPPPHLGPFCFLTPTAVSPPRAAWTTLHTFCVSGGQVKLSSSCTTPHLLRQWRWRWGWGANCCVK